MIEYEVKIAGIDMDESKRRLRESGAVLIHAAYTHQNITYHLPAGQEIPGGWLRARDEGGLVTMSLKIIDGERMADQREFRLVADSLEEADEFLRLMGAREKARQEKRREAWRLGNCEVVIDQWPFLEPLLEVEGPDEAAVKEAVIQLGYTLADCRVCAVDVLYSEKYGVTPDLVDNHTSRLLFDMPNPFLP